MKREVLRLERVCLVDQSTHYLENFSLSIFEGEIMGLLALDGHGLSALIELLKKNLPIQRGTIYYWGAPINSQYTQHTGYNRIAVIQRESSLVDRLSVTENIFILRPNTRALLTRTRLMYRQLQSYWDRIGISIPVDALVEDLTPFERCVVELVKAVVTGCRLIILRDIGAFLSEGELERLHQIICYYAAQNFTFLYIGYHMEELCQICGRIAVLDNAQIIKIMRPDELLSHRSDGYFQIVQEHFQREQTPAQSEKPVFAAEALWSGNMHSFSFSVSAGECVVLQDMSNQLFPDLLAALIGEQPIIRGAFYLDGERFLPGISRQAAIVQARPFRSMLFPGMSYLDNLCFTMDDRMREIWRNASVQRGLKKACIERFGDDLFDMRPENLTRVQQYDLVYRRILLQNPKVVFCIQPFLGADLALRAHICDLLKSLLRQGMAVVILTVNLADSLSLADRLIRIRQDLPDEVYERKDFANLPFTAPHSPIV